MNEEALAHWGGGGGRLSRQKTNKNIIKLSLGNNEIESDINTNYVLNF